MSDRDADEQTEKPASSAEGTERAKAASSKKASPGDVASISTTGASGERTRASAGEEEARARRLLATGAVTSVFGIAVGAMVTHTLGGVILVVGWAFFLYGLHAYGRSAPASSRDA